MARNSIDFDWMAQFFANRGYAVLQPNFRGSAGYGEKFETAGYGQWGLKMQDDISDGVKKLIADGIADPKRICIVGASYGGYAAIAGAMLTPDLYACAVSFAGYRTSICSSGTTWPNPGAGTMSPRGTNTSAAAIGDAEKLAAASPAKARRQGQVPGAAHARHGRQHGAYRSERGDARALQKAGKKVQFVKFEGDSHYMQLADTRIRMLKETAAFLQKNIGE